MSKDLVDWREAFLTRRGFVTTGIFAAAATVLPTWAQSTAADPDKRQAVKLGLASYTFRDFNRTQLIQFMQQLKVYDLNAKDVKDHLPNDSIEEAKALADYSASGIKLHAAGALYFTAANEADMRNKFEYCKRAGIGVMVAGDPEPEDLPFLERLAEQYDMRIAIHNHGPEDKRWHSPLDVLAALKDRDPRIGCCIDVGHAARAGTDVVEAIHQVGPRLFNMHMKDLTSFSDKQSQVAVGDGIMPVRRIFEALIAIHYQGFVDLEYEVHPDDPMPGVIASFAYMRGVQAGMA